MVAINLEPLKDARLNSVLVEAGAIQKEWELPIFES
jgi:hypothetical protein